jgi:hypothetical protein
MSPYEVEIRAVLSELVRVHPFPLSASELVAACQLPHGQRAGGILRRLQNDGLAESELHREGRLWWATPAAAAAHEIFSAPASFGPNIDHFRDFELTKPPREEAVSKAASEGSTA